MDQMQKQDESSELQLIKKYFKLSDLKEEQLIEFHEALMEANSRVNLISRRDTEHIWERHILHSLAIAKHISFKSDDIVMDGGTGGGFPGVPLAIMFPGTKFVLVDSIRKKTIALSEIISSMGLKNVVVKHERMEDVGGRFDYVITRAVAPLSKLMAWSRKRLKTGNKKRGLICLKGGNLRNEIAEVKEKVHLIPVSRWFDEPFFKEKFLLHVNRY